MTTPEQHLEAHRSAGREFEAAGVRSFVREEGHGEPVVCLHGVPASTFLYRKVLREHFIQEDQAPEIASRIAVAGLEG